MPGCLNFTTIPQVFFSKPKKHAIFCWTWPKKKIELFDLFGSLMWRFLTFQRCYFMKFICLSWVLLENLFFVCFKLQPKSANKGWLKCQESVLYFLLMWRQGWAEGFRSHDRGAKTCRQVAKDHYVHNMTVAISGCWTNLGIKKKTLKVLQTPQKLTFIPILGGNSTLAILDGRNGKWVHPSYAVLLYTPEV